jgi:hypothetical protein
MRTSLSASLPGVSAAIRKAIYDASNWEDLHFLVKARKWPRNRDEQTAGRGVLVQVLFKERWARGAIRMVIGLLALVAPWLIVRRFGGAND